MARILLTPLLFCSSLTPILSVAVLVLTLSASAAEAPPATHPGAVIYQKMCAECHGDKGQGVEGKDDDPLTGTRLPDALAKKIAKTMPKDHEGTCVGEDAKQVAAYIFDAFYSPEAQLRNHPPAKDLARLTIPQYRNCVMDLLGRFSFGAGFDRPITQERGLKGSYKGFELPKPGEPAPDPKASKKEKKNRPAAKFDRLDGRIAFHFGGDSPDKDKMMADEFHLRWEGSILAPETGVYEFSVKTENGARLWINDTKKELIDGWVSNGPEVREEKKTIFLVGGRPYTLALEHFKFQEKSASIELWWKPPHGVKEIVPAEALRSERSPRRLIISTNFPADDRSAGYERGTSISKGWDQATTEGAIATAEYVEDHLDELCGTKPGAPDREEKCKKFCTSFVEAAFRHPLSEEDKASFIAPNFAKAKRPELAVKRTVLFTLKSPQFLYPDLLAKAQPDDFDIAARLALALWDSLPDRKLTLAATTNKLHTREQVKAEALRMMADSRTKEKLHGFFYHWLEFERAEGSSKDMKAFPGFDDDVMADLRKSLIHFVDDVVWSPKSDYRELLQADYLLLNDRLGKFYGKPVEGEEFQRVSFDPKQRAGVVTHPYLLASLAYAKQSSPVHRGVFLTRNIVGMSLKPPPMAVSFDDSHFKPNLTMREKVTEMTRNTSCMGCHSVINPLGFSLENFDAVGRWRTNDNNKPVNPVSDFVNDEGQKVHLTGPRDVVDYVANHRVGQEAFIRQIFQHTVKQQIPAFGPHAMEQLERTFSESNCSVQALLLETALTAALDGAPSSPAGVAQK